MAHRIPARGGRLFQGTGRILSAPFAGTACCCPGTAGGGGLGTALCCQTTAPPYVISVDVIGPTGCDDCFTWSDSFDVRTYFSGTCENWNPPDTDCPWRWGFSPPFGINSSPFGLYLSNPSFPGCNDEFAPSSNIAHLKCDISCIDPAGTATCTETRFWYLTGPMFGGDGFWVPASGCRGGFSAGQVEFVDGDCYPFFLHFRVPVVQQSGHPETCPCVGEFIDVIFTGSYV